MLWMWWIGRLCDVWNRREALATAAPCVGSRDAPCFFETGVMTIGGLLALGGLLLWSLSLAAIGGIVFVAGLAAAAVRGILNAL